MSDGGKTPPAAAARFTLAAEVVRDVAVAAVVLVLVGIFLVQPFRVEGQSMEPYLESGQRIFVSKIAYRFGPVRRFDVVVARGPDGRTLVKRVVGLPGETVELVDGTVYVDGTPLPEMYVTDACRSHDSRPPERLGRDSYFVLGDNRPVSLDSRRRGPIPRASIRGKAVWRYWPPRAAGRLDVPRFPAGS